jgi:hypothetical protein
VSFVFWVAPVDEPSSLPVKLRPSPFVWLDDSGEPSAFVELGWAVEIGDLIVALTYIGTERASGLVAPWTFVE